MNLLLPYIIKSVVSVAILYACYQLMLKREAIFRFNRAYLLFSLVVASLLPLFSFDITPTFSSPNQTTDYLVTYQLPTITLDTVYIYGSPQNNGLSWIDLITILYFTGVVVKLFQFIFRLGQIIILTRKSESFTEDGYRLVLFNKEIPIFSFFNMIFMGKNTHNIKDAETIIRHEKIHINQMHSLDLILAELLIIIQWFNPFAFLLKKSIKENHEFIADNAVVSTNIDHHNYKLLLIEHSGKIKTNTLTHNFSYSLLKRRLQMINKPKRPLRTILGISGATISIVLVLFACSTQPANEQSPESENASVINGKEQLPDSLRPQVVLVGNPYKEGVVQPTFPEGSEKLMALLNQEVEFPSVALENNTRGYVYAQFTIEKDGSVDNGTIKKSLSKECDEEVLRIIRMMPDWTPGTENGKPIAIDNKLYVNFNMKRDVTDPNKVVKDQLSGQDSIFTVVKHMPEFPGGIESLMNYLATNITYPEQARKANLEGRVFINFIVEKDGSVSSVNVLRGIGGGCDKEAVRVVENMPAWKPGRNEAGEPVRVSYNIPIKFTLSEKK